MWELPFNIVLLQAMKEDPPLDAKCKDKFLVQAVAITGDLEFANVTSVVSLRLVPKYCSYRLTH